MAPPKCIRISEELLTEWAMSCVRIIHLVTLIQRELPPGGEHVRAIDLAGRVEDSASTLFAELRQHGARNSNARIENPQCIQIPIDLPTRWAENCIHIYNLGTLINRELPRDRIHCRAIDLAGRVIRRASTMYSELLQHGANPSSVDLD
jgi:hypothetical protein